MIGHIIIKIMWIDLQIIMTRKNCCQVDTELTSTFESMCVVSRSILIFYVSQALSAAYVSTQIVYKLTFYVLEAAND